MVAEGKDSDPEINDQSGAEFPENDQSDNLPGELFPDETNDSEIADESIPADNQSSTNFQSPNRGDNANVMPVSAITNIERVDNTRQRIYPADVNTRPAMREREQAYATPTQSPNTFDSTNHDISNIFNNEQMMRYNERVREATERIMREEQRRANPSPIVDIPATDATIPVKSFHIRSYTQTTQLIKDEIDRLRISTNTVNKTKNMREMHVALQASGLLTLLLEQRTMPLVTETNKFGHREPYVYLANPNQYDSDTDSISSPILQEPSMIPIGEDDIGLFSHDRSRLMYLVQRMFHISAHSYGHEYEVKNDPVGYYKALKKHMFGKLPRDLTTAINNFYQLKLNRNNTIRLEIVRLNEIIEVLDSINTTPVTPDQKLAFIIRIFDGDARQFVSNGMSHAVIEQWDYDLTMQRLLHAEESQAPRQRPAHIGAITNAKPFSNNDNNDNEAKRHCINWKKWGSCRTPQCKYWHELDPSLSNKKQKSQINNRAADNTKYKPVNKGQESHPNKVLLKENPIDQSHRSVVKFAVTESNINRVGKPNGEGRNTAEGWSRSQLAKLHSLHNDGQISQEGPDHRINFFYVHHSNNDEYSVNYDMSYRLQEEYNESLYNNYNENDRQCGYHDLYANRYDNVTNNSTNHSQQYNISTNNSHCNDNNNDDNSNHNHNNNNNNNYDNNEYTKSAGIYSNEYNNNCNYYGWTREAIEQLSADTNYSHIDHTFNVMRVEKRKYKSSPLPNDTEVTDIIQIDQNDRENEELDNQLDNYTSLRNAAPVIKHVESNDSESDVTIIPDKIDNKSNNKKDSDSESTSSSHPSSKSEDKNINIPVIPKLPRSNKSDSTEEIIISSPKSDLPVDKDDESEATSRRLRPIQRNDIPLPPQGLHLEHIAMLDGDRSLWNYHYIRRQLNSNMIAGTPLHIHRHIRTALLTIMDYYLDSNEVIEYNPLDPTVSVNPRTYVSQTFTDQMDPIGWTIYLFDANPDNDSYANHRNRDVTTMTIPMYTLILNVSRIAFGGITNTTNVPILINSWATNIHHQYIQSPNPGHYMSQINEISEYFPVIEIIGSLRINTGANTNMLCVDILAIALLHDLMSFVAHQIGYFPFNVRRVAFQRNELIREIRQHSGPYWLENNWYGMFHIVIQQTCPAYTGHGITLNPRVCVDVHRYFMFKRNTLEPKEEEKSLDNLLQSTDITNFFQYSLTLSNLSASKHDCKIIIDTGASVSATSDTKILQNVRPCKDMSACPAFGPKINPKLRGDFGNLGLDTLIIENMKDTLISVSQICKGGKSNNTHVAVFTADGVRIFEQNSITRALSIMHIEGVEILRGLEENGIYISTKSDFYISHRLFMAQFKPKSQYDHVHHVTGHPGERGMKWHRQNSINASYSDEDMKRTRPVCKGCVYGSLSQTPTDHNRQHREIPLIPGQCFALDAYTHPHYSSRGNKYCDIYTDLATRRNYPVFTVSREASELCDKTELLFLQHPEWASSASKCQVRFVRLDSESNYRSVEFLKLVSKLGYKLERTPVRDKPAGGIAERAVGLISAKTNIAMMTPEPPVPQKFWDYAMAYACDTQSYNYSSVIGTSPYMKITGQPVNIKYLQPFWSSCYVFIPKKERNKIGAPRAYKAHFAGYVHTTLLFPNYIVIPVTEGNYYNKHKDSKDVIFDPSINFSVYTEDEEPYDREFQNKHHYIPTSERCNAPDNMRGPDATPLIGNDNNGERQLISPQREKLPILNKQIKIPSNITEHRIDDQQSINKYHLPLEDHDGSPVYWYNLHVENYEYPLIMCETANFYKMKVARDPNVPTSFYKAMKIPEWAAAIDKELTKFEKNLCLQLVPFNGQHLVPMMWTFVLKTDGTRKARLVGRGDLMIPYVDFDPNAVYCGNVTACSIKICITIAAKYKLEYKGGDLEGAYLVTRQNPKYPVYITKPQGYDVPEGMCIQATGNLYGFPPAGQNFSKEFDKCVKECGYLNTPWDLKFFYKWVDDSPILLIVHSDDFRWFGAKKHMNHWQILVNNFEQHKYKVSDVTEDEFVGINITRDDKYNYYMDQTRMIDDILSDHQMKNANDEKLPYPLDGEKLSKLDNATDKNIEECKRFPYRRIVGQLMYGMVHTLVTISYALNVLSRYGNNPGPRHIKFAKHLLKYVRTTRKDRLMFPTYDGETDITSMTKELQLWFQCDADLAGNPDTKHSQTSYLGYLGNSLICWCSTDQGSMATSTAESEIKAVNHTLKCEVIANRGILNQMGWTQSPTVIEEDNKACVDASIVSHMTRGLRHLDITQNFLKEKFADGTCVLKKIESKNNNADIGTKRLAFPIFDYLTYPLMDRSLRDEIKSNKNKNKSS